MEEDTKYNPSSSTGHIAQNIGKLHKDSVLKEMKRMYLEENEAFFRKGADGRKMLRDVVSVVCPCPICGSEKEKSEFVVNVNGFNHLRCLVCKNIYVSPRLKDKYIFEQYSRPSYTFMFRNLIESTLQFRRDVIARGKYNWVIKHLKNKKTGSLLDVGSGLGENLAVYKEHGWEVVGIEFNNYAAQKSRELFGVKVLNEPIEKADLPRNKFDVISFWGVLEHLTNPVRVLEESIKYLASDGVFVVMVPNFVCLLSSYLQDYPEDADRLLDGDKHITLFTKEGMRYLAEKVGLKIDSLTTRGLDFVTVLNYLHDEKDTRLHKLIKKELPAIQGGIEKMGFGDHLWVILSRTTNNTE